MLIGLPVLFLVAATLFVSTFAKKTPSGEGTVVISSAQVETSIAGEQQRGVVALPYHWDSLHPGQEGTAVFSMNFDVAEAPSEPWALQLPKIGNAYEIRLNGELVARSGNIDVHAGDDCALLRRYVPLGSGPAKGRNLLTITIRADRGRDAGLSTVIVGPAGRLREDHDRRYNWTIVSTASISAISLAVGLLSLGLWRSQSTARVPGGRGDEALYLYAALAELTEAAVAGTGLIGSPPLPWPWWGVAWNTTLGASILFMVLTCVEIARWGDSAHAVRLRRWLVALVLAGPAMNYAALGIGVELAMVAWYLALGVTVAVFGGFFVVRALRGAELPHQLAAIAIAANLIAGVHDFDALSSAGDYLHISALVYSSILFDLTLGVIVILRFREAHRRIREAMATLEERVTAKETELRQSYRKLESLARTQERLNERASILRDMHDGVGAHLSMAMRQIESGHFTREDLVPPLRDALDQLKLTIDNVNLPAGDVASLMGNLRYRLGTRIESSGIRLDWKVDSLAPVDRLDGQAMRQLMFILFEAISNVLQHSGASALRVEAREADGGIEVRIVDNGVGFDVASSRERGLLTMENRAERIGARLEIRSQPGETCVEVRIPRA